MIIIRILWIMILAVISMAVLAGALWVLRVAVDWWLDIDYVKKIKEFIEHV